MLDNKQRKMPMFSASYKLSQKHMKPGDRYGVLLDLGLGNNPRDKQLKRNPLSKDREEFYMDMRSFNKLPQKPADVKLPLVQENIDGRSWRQAINRHNSAIGKGWSQLKAGKPESPFPDKKGTLAIILPHRTMLEQAM